MGGHERAHQAGTGRGQERAGWALASVAEREPGTQKPPGWFVNRSQKIAADGSIVQTQTTASGSRASGKSGVSYGFAQKRCYALAAHPEDRGKLCHGQAFGVQSLGFGPPVQLPMHIQQA